ncbi:hypothetical protein [Naasia sp. SYSU D00948]|uniref:hypothetical protein n=1 Tax=Naasia sp. SYSU D00948 TaxID=2817379 RepID=UPI001B314870|nr:hypothetical protein [Naasia sp. SYSU D00948]
MDSALLIAGAAVAVVVLAVVLVLSGRARRSAARIRAAQGRAPRVEEGRRSQVDEGRRSQVDELQRSAGSALVQADERLRLADDELGFAIAEFGEEAAAPFRAALQRGRQRLTEAFQLNQLLTDAAPDSEAQRREWSERIVSLCRSAEQALAEENAALAARRTAARRTPAQVAELRAELGRVREAVPEARATLAALAERYTGEALIPVSGNADEAERLLSFAERSLEVAQSRLGASRESEAVAAAQAAAETIRRAEELLAAVDRFEVEALQAEATLAAMVAESRQELAAARALPEGERRGAIEAAITALDEALAALPSPGARVDPVASLNAVRSANTALDEAVAERAGRAERKERLRTQLVTAIDDAERQLAVARQLVTDYGASVGPHARTLLATAERELAGLTEEREPEPAIARARRAAALAADASAAARADLQRGPAPGAWRQGGGRPGLGAPPVLGGVLGGLAIGSLLDGIGDVGDLFD